MVCCCVVYGRCGQCRFVDRWEHGGATLTAIAEFNPPIANRLRQWQPLSSHINQGQSHAAHPAMSSLPHRTDILIVGAGPCGLATALSLRKQGCNDITVVDCITTQEHTSRALAVHAATLEVSFRFCL